MQQRLVPHVSGSGLSVSWLLSAVLNVAGPFAKSSKTFDACVGMTAHAPSTGTADVHDTSSWPADNVHWMPQVPPYPFG